MATVGCRKVGRLVSLIIIDAEGLKVDSITAKGNVLVRHRNYSDACDSRFLMKRTDFNKVMKGNTIEGVIDFMKFSKTGYDGDSLVTESHYRMLQKITW